MGLGRAVKQIPMNLDVADAAQGKNEHEHGAMVIQYQHRQWPTGVDVMDSGLVPAKGAGRCAPRIARVGIELKLAGYCAQLFARLLFQVKFSPGT